MISSQADVYSSVLGQSVLEANSTGVQRAYVYAGNKLVAQQSADGQFYWLHTNHLNSARAMTDTSGTLVYKGQFDPYGQALSEWSATGNTNLNTKKFTGYERDAATGLDYANARMYHSARGRFATPDPLGMKASDPKNPQSLNRYAYTQNDPVNFVDKSGMFREAPDGNNGGSPECRSTFVTIGWIERDGPTGTGFLSYGFTYTSCINSSGGMILTEGEADRVGFLKKAAGDLAKKKLDKKECQELLAALGVTADQVRAGAEAANIMDGVGSTVLRSTLYETSPYATVRQAGTNITNTVGNELAKPGTVAVAQLGGSAIYVDPKKFDVADYWTNLSVIFHEVLHNVTGLTDEDIQGKLGLDQNKPSHNITEKLKKDCF